MNLKQRIREKALELGIDDIGFTSADPLDLYIKEIDSRGDMYDWVKTDRRSDTPAAQPAPTGNRRRTLVHERIRSSAGAREAA